MKFISLISFVLTFSLPSLAFRIFYSRDEQVRLVIDQCRSKAPNEAIQCYVILRCILNNVTSDFPARWSAGASILSFVPTVVGLMSNSMNENMRIAEQSVFLATALSLSSVTTFTSRFIDVSANTAEFSLERRTRQARSLDDAWASLCWLVHQKCPENRSKWWPQPDFLAFSFGVLLLASSGALWFEVYKTSQQGIVTFACRIKTNVYVWVGLSQLFALLSLASRRLLFLTSRIYLGPGNDTTGPTLVRSAKPPGGWAPLSRIFPRSTDHACFCVVLRSPRSGPLSLSLRTLFAVISYALYTFGTVILASMTLIPATDAVQATLVLTLTAGFGRMVGFWAESPSRCGSQTIIIDIAAEFREDFKTLVLEKVNRPVTSNRQIRLAGRTGNGSA